MRLMCILLLVGCLAAPVAAQQTPAGHTATGGKAKSVRQKHKPAKAAPAQPQAQPQEQPQEQPAQQPAAQDQAPAAQEQPAEGKQATPRDLLVGVGWSRWGLSGNETKFRQYATPPRDFFIPEISYAPLASPMGYQGAFALKGLLQSDQYYQGVLDYNWGTSRLEGWYQRNKYFDPTPFVIPQSAEEWFDGSFRQLLGPSWGLSINGRQDRQYWVLEQPRFPLYYTTNYSSAVANGRIGRGELGFLASNWHMYDRTGVFPDTSVTRLQAQGRWQVTGPVGVEASFARSEIAQPGRPNSHVETTTVGGDWALGDSTAVEFLLRRDNIDLPVVQSAVVRQQRLGDLRLIHRFRNWTAQVGTQEREVERVNGTHTYVDVPRWWIVNARLDGRVTRDIRLSLRGQHESLSNGPVQDTLDPRPLYWADKTLGQLKLEAGWPAATAYLVGTYRRMENGSRSTAVMNRNVTAGGSYDVSPVLSLFAEYAYDSWIGQSEVIAFPTLANFMPDTRVTTLGLNWTLNRRALLWAGYTDFITTNDNPLLLRDANTHGKFLTVTLRYLLPSGSTLGLTLAPWSYQDKVASQMNYDTAVVMVTGTGKF